MIINEPEIAVSAIKTVHKVWGTEYWILNEPKYCMKYLKIIPGYQCSIHAHKKKAETFVGISGTLQLNIHDAKDAKLVHCTAITPGARYNLAPGTFHSFQATNVTWVCEVSTHHDDEDVIRLQESRKLETQ